MSYVTSDTPASKSHRRMIPSRRWVIVGVATAVGAVGAFGMTVGLTGQNPELAGERVSMSTLDPEVDSGILATPGDESAESEALPMVTVEVFLPRDPFEPVVPEPVDAPASDDAAGGGAGDGGAGVGGAGVGGAGVGAARDGGAGDDGAGVGGAGNDGATDAGTPTDGVVNPGIGVLPPSGKVDACTGTREVVCDGRVISLLDIVAPPDGSPTAVIQVASGVFEVSAGEAFGEHFTVGSLEPPCVDLSYGDDYFQLCLGETVLK